MLNSVARLRWRQFHQDHVQVGAGIEERTAPPFPMGTRKDLCQWIWRRGQDCRSEETGALGLGGGCSNGNARNVASEGGDGPPLSWAHDTIDSPTGPRQVTVRDAVNQLFLGRMLKGATVPIRIDPTNPAKIAVLWDTQ